MTVGLVVLQTMAGSSIQPGSKVRVLEDRHQLLGKVQGEGVAQETLVAQLAHHVERIHSDLASPSLQLSPLFGCKRMSGRPSCPVLLRFVW